MVYEEEVKKVLNYFENQNLIDDLLSRICFSVNYDYEINFEGSYEDPDWLPITCHDVDLPGDSPFVDKFSVELTKTIIIAFDKSVKKECEKETYQARGKMADYERKYKEIIYEGKNHKIFPDFILHERGSNSNNILAIEFKNFNNNKIAEIKKDCMKLKAVTNNSGMYKYKLGLFIKFGINRDKVIVRKFINGKEQKR